MATGDLGHSLFVLYVLVPLERAEALTLIRTAAVERRSPKQQAAYLLSHALTDVGGELAEDCSRRRALQFATAGRPGAA